MSLRAEASQLNITFASLSQLLYQQVANLPPLYYRASAEEAIFGDETRVAYSTPARPTILDQTSLLPNIDQTVSSLWNVRFEKEMYHRVLGRLIHTMYSESREGEQQVRRIFDISLYQGMQHVAQNAVAYIALSRQAEKTIVGHIKRMIWRKDAVAVGRVLYGSDGYDAAKVFLNHSRIAATGRRITQSQLRG